LIGKPVGKRKFGTLKRKLENNIKMGLKEIVWGSGDWIYLAQDRDRWRAVLNTVMNLRVP
jgi:hypothetical protein